MDFSIRDAMPGAADKPVEDRGERKPPRKRFGDRKDKKEDKKED